MVNIYEDSKIKVLVHAWETFSHRLSPSVSGNQKVCDQYVIDNSFLSLY